jgi:Xaa-Pro aminopeptidase
LKFKDYENEYGTFLKFDTLTYVPIDLELIDKSYLSDIDIQRLNDYHKAVYENLSPFMNDDERKKLKEATRSI